MLDLSSDSQVVLEYLYRRLPVGEPGALSRAKRVRCPLPGLTQALLEARCPMGALAVEATKVACAAQLFAFVGGAGGAGAEPTRGQEGGRGTRVVPKPVKERETGDEDFSLWELVSTEEGGKSLFDAHYVEPLVADVFEGFVELNQDVLEGRSLKTRVENLLKVALSHLDFVWQRVGKSVTYEGLLGAKWRVPRRMAYVGMIFNISVISCPTTRRTC